MDDIFSQDEFQSDFFWYEIGTVVNPSAFVPYTSKPHMEIRVESSFKVQNSTNVNKRKIEFMRRSWPPRIEAQVPDCKRSYRHMISERLRREKEKNGYLALHSMLPVGTKKDKNSIMLMAGKSIQVLQRYKETMQRRNCEIQERLAAMGSGDENVGSTKIRIKVANPKSGVDSLVDVLKCLKTLGSKTRSIQSQISVQELEAVIDIDSEIEADDVEMAVKRTLEGCWAETSLPFPGRSDRS